MFRTWKALPSAFHPDSLYLANKISSSSVARNFHSYLPTCASYCSSRKFLPTSSSQRGRILERKYYAGETKTISLSKCSLIEQYRTYSLRSFFSSSKSKSNSQQGTEGEGQLKSTIRKCFPNATNIVVEDISGGCGSMYSVFIEAPDFQGLSTVKQHLLVNQALKQEIKSMHGIRIQTAASKNT